MFVHVVILSVRCFVTVVGPMPSQPVRRRQAHPLQMVVIAGSYIYRVLDYVAFVQLTASGDVRWVHERRLRHAFELQEFRPLSLQRLRRRVPSLWHCCCTRGHGGHPAALLAPRHLRSKARAFFTKSRASQLIRADVWICEALLQTAT